MLDVSRRTQPREIPFLCPVCLHRQSSVRRVGKGCKIYVLNNTLSTPRLRAGWWSVSKKKLFAYQTCRLFQISLYVKPYPVVGPPFYCKPGVDLGAWNFYRSVPLICI